MQEARAQPVATVKILVPSSPTAPPLESVIRVDDMGIPPTASSIPYAGLFVLGIGFDVLLLLTASSRISFLEDPSLPPIYQRLLSPQAGVPGRDDLSWWLLSSD